MARYEATEAAEVLRKQYCKDAGWRSCDVCDCGKIKKYCEEEQVVCGFYDKPLEYWR